MLHLPDTITIQNAVCMEPVSLSGQDLLSLAATSLDQICPGTHAYQM